MKEEWRTIPDWNLYEISNLGNLRSKDRIIRNNNGEYLRKGRVLKTVDDKHGYKTFRFTQNGRQQSIKIHRLVAQVFIPNPENKPCVNHLDNNPANNHVDNLEWCTMQENTDWMIAQGRFERTEEWLNNLHVSQEPIYKPVKGTNISTGESLYFNRLNAVKSMGFQPSCVCVCCKNKNGVTQHLGYTWKYITKEEYENAIGKSNNNLLQQKATPNKSLRKSNTKRIQNITTGEIFHSVKEAREKYGLARMDIKRAMVKGWKIQGCEWRYIDDTSEGVEIQHETRQNKGNIDTSEDL